MHGKGEAKYPNGDAFNFYEGEFINGKRHGYGVMKYVSGETYEGYWAEGERSSKTDISLPDDQSDVTGAATKEEETAAKEEDADKPE